MFQQASINLRTRASNSAELRKWFDSYKKENNENATAAIEDAIKVTTVITDTTNDKAQKILGLTWNKKTDMLILNIQIILLKYKDMITIKRELLRFAALIFKALGILILAEMSLKMWKEENYWDSKTSSDTLKEWSVWRTGAEKHHQIQISQS